MKTKFCERCLKDTKCHVKEEVVTEVIEHQKITYLKKYYVCSECDQIIYDDFLDYNIETINNELRKNNNIITVSEIKEILEKYNIGKKPASLVLGLGEITLTRYLDGNNPTEENSLFLKEILNNPNLYELYLLTNKDKITEIAFKKSLGKTKQLELSNEHSKLYNIALYIINKLDEVTPLSLQKILYFADGFSKKILGEDLFNNSPEAWIHGPVYREIYECFSYYKSNTIYYSEILKDYEFNLTEEEKKYLDKITLIFGCYSGRILREMTHLTEPWVESRKGLAANEPTNRMIEKDQIDKYFNKVCEEYQIKTINDISNYSQSIFQKAVNELKNNY